MSSSAASGSALPTQPPISAREALRLATERHARLKTELAEAQTDITFFRALLAKERVQALNREWVADIELAGGGDGDEGGSEERVGDSQDSDVAAEKRPAKRDLPKGFCRACHNLAQNKAPQVGHTYAGLCTAVDKRRKGGRPTAAGAKKGVVAQQEEQQQEQQQERQQDSEVPEDEK